MSAERILRLYVQRGWPRDEPSCRWALLTRDLQVIERGASDASRWPAADECEAVVTANQLSWLSIKLPEKLGRDAEQIIAYALEDKLLQPPEAMHIVICRAGKHGARSAIAIERTRVAEIVDAVRASGRRLDRLYADMQLAPCADDEWTVCGFGQTAFLSMGASLGLAIDWPGAAPPDALMLARSRGNLPARIVARLPAELASSILAGWSAALGLSIHVGQAFDPLTARADAACNLLTGPFAASAGSGFVGRSLRLAALTLLLAGVGHTLLSMTDWAWLAHRASALRAEATAIYREAIPDSKLPLLNPSLQLHREADNVLRQRGKAGGGDMLTMLALFSEVLPAEFQARRMQFDHSALEVVAVLPADAVSRMAATLRLRGYGVDAVVLRQDAAGIEYKIRMYQR